MKAKLTETLEAARNKAFEEADEALKALKAYEALNKVYKAYEAYEALDKVYKAYEAIRKEENL